MNCREIKQLFPDYLIGDLDTQTQTTVQNHMARCDACREELESLSEIWTKLGVVPDQHPGDSLRTRFYAMLEAYKHGLEQQRSESRRRSFTAWLEQWWPRQPAFQLSLTLFVLAAGLTAGLLIKGGSPSGEQLSPLRREVNSLRLTMASSLLDNQSASDRIKGINMSAELADPGGDLLGRLLDTLENDDSINVRLAAVDALYLFRDRPGVREGLTRSLSRQESPFVQVALIDLIVSLREQRAVEALRSLLQNENLNTEVKERAEQGLVDLM